MAARRPPGARPTTEETHDVDDWLTVISSGRCAGTGITSATVTESARAASTNVRLVLTQVGGRFALHATGVGLVLLAHAPAEVQEEVLGSPLRRFTEETIVDPHRLRRVLADVRRNGYAVSSRQVTMDAVSVAAPIFGPEETVIASVSLVVQADDARPLALAPVVQAAARGISRAVGATRAAPPEKRVAASS